NNGVLEIELDGSLAGANVNGLNITAASTVKGLIINRFAGGAGISLSTVASAFSDIEGNWIGINAAGAAAAPNARGILVTAGSAADTIGGTIPQQRNVISGNTGPGIQLDDGAGDAIEGNFIGTSASGAADVGNGIGISIAAASHGHTIGGGNVATRNIISGNDGGGIS